MVGPLGHSFGNDSLSKWLHALLQGSPEPVLHSSQSPEQHPYTGSSPTVATPPDQTASHAGISYFSYFSTVKNKTNNNKIQKLDGFLWLARWVTLLVTIL